ncbi:hypothetical protein J2S74_004981 [Evansella vedderi]|uniref:Uncharacterized protein n=1 Tax=Evansella vedderi TaxID=38282 RepID=A0ABU0A204_9BACI|nr:hypothetical protein [Evansella vedderi]MDQ0257523.1 hypothetical protein [Evansella vedderi]
MSLRFLSLIIIFLLSGFYLFQLYSSNHALSYLPEEGKVYTYKYPITDLFISIHYTSIPSDDLTQKKNLLGTVTFEDGWETEIHLTESKNTTEITFVTSNTSPLILSKPLEVGDRWESNVLDPGTHSSSTEKYEIVDIIEDYGFSFGTIEEVVQIKKTISSRDYVGTEYFYIASNIGLLYWDKIYEDDERVRYKELVDIK